MRIPNFLKKKIKQQLEISQERKKKKKELPGFMRDQNNFDCTGTNELQLKSKKAFKLNTFKQGFIRLQTTGEDSLSGRGIRLSLSWVLQRQSHARSSFRRITR